MGLRFRLPGRVLFAAAVLIASVALYGCPMRPEVFQAGPAAVGPVAAPVPAPPPAAAPTVSLSAYPTAIVQGECATLTWSTTNATRVSIDAGVGGVDLGGSRQVCPASSTQYTIAVLGAGGAREASAMVAVTPVVDRLTLHVNFDFDKTNIRNVDTAELQKAIEFAAKYPGHASSVVGHTDSIGTAQYNQALSERRAAAVKAYLLQHGVADVGRITTAGFGEAKPVADNATKEGRFENRRVELLILSK